METTSSNHFVFPNASHDNMKDARLTTLKQSLAKSKRDHGETRNELAQTKEQELNSPRPRRNWMKRSPPRNDVYPTF